jgi:hypothetical protein
MSKHVIDHRKPSTGAKTRAFMTLDRRSEDKVHPAAQTLHQRGQSARGDSRMRQFLRIERGQTA